MCIKHDDKRQAFFDALDAETKAMRDKRISEEKRIDYRPKRIISLPELAAKTHQTHDKAFIQCHYCGKLVAISRITRDHKIPKSKGGIGKENIVPACRSCNTEKADMMYIEYILWRRANRKQITVWCQQALDEVINIPR